MTDEEKQLLVNLNTQVKQLFEAFARVEIHKKVLANEIVELKNEIENQKKENLELVKKNEQLRLATQILSGVDEDREAKTKINKLIREIDKCIALLNK